jgi:hypothetical protein
MDRPSADAATVGASLTPPAPQTKLSTPVRPVPVRPAGRSCYAVSPVQHENPTGYATWQLVILRSFLPECAGAVE